MKEADDAKAAAKTADDKLKETKAAAEKDSKNKDLAKAVDDAKKTADEAAKKVADTKRRVEETASAAKQPERELKRAEKAVEAYAHLAQKNNTMIVPGHMGEVAGLIGTAMALFKGGHAGLGGKAT